MFMNDWWIPAIAIALIGLLITAVVIDSKRWEEFSAAHKCKVVGKMQGDVNPGVGIGANGQATAIVTTTSSKTGWLCDDGVTYWR